ncbi:phage portal protein [Bartonella grahamii as4aup]|uniref:Phage portal protein n=1 Tax=Bartonella grahamii (strain as4aup) TaxID=634504 RepID=C6ABY5_BARGA|nr:phage portal protein [Bartonella grahamii]ACS50698.1 phage portal protein [Bartonella grahamii as4aup]ACS51184.1 phage portal protein [Bartonella grahamii as4aup]
MAGFFNKLTGFFTISRQHNPHFEAASKSRRMGGFDPAKKHINKAIEECGDTIVARSRWLYDNEALYGSATEEWVSAAVSDGIKPYPRIEGFQEEKKKLLDLWWQWVDEADYDEDANFYGLQATIAREVFLTGECFVRLHYVDLYGRSGVPLQLQVYPTEMLDLSYNGPAEIEGNYIRMGIEFNASGKRVAYHFWEHHPYDDVPANMAFESQERVRVPAEMVIHIKERRIAGQLRGSPKITRAMTKIFQLESYDDAELDRKRTAALFAAFVKDNSPNVEKLSDNRDKNNVEEEYKAPVIAPGASLYLGENKEVTFSNPVEVGGSYEAFQFRNILKICAALNMPYAVVTGDVTRGNFSNVRTSIIQFRRHVKQWREHIIAFQFNRIVWERFVEMAVLVKCVNLPGWEENSLPWLQCESFAPPLEMIDPNKDISAEKEEIRAGLKTRRMALAERGFDIDSIHAELQEEHTDARARGLSFDTDMAAPSGSNQVIDPADSEPSETYESNQSSEAHANGE